MASEGIHERFCCHHEKEQCPLEDLQQRFEECRSYFNQEREFMQTRITSLESLVSHWKETVFQSTGEKPAGNEIWSTPQQLDVSPFHTSNPGQSTVGYCTRVKVPSLEAAEVPFQKSDLVKPQSSGPKLGLHVSSQLQQPAISEVINITKIDGSSLISEHTVINSRQQSTTGHATGVRVPSLEDTPVTIQKSEVKPQSSGPKLGGQVSSQLQQPATEVINLTKIAGSSLISEHTIDSREQSTIGHVTDVRVPSFEAAPATFQKCEAKPQSSGPKLGVQVSSQLQQPATSEVINLTKIDGSSLISEHTINSRQQSTIGHVTGVRGPSLEATLATVQKSEAKPQSSAPKLGGQVSSQLQQPATSEVINLTKIAGSLLISEHTINSRQQSITGHVTGVRVPSLEAAPVTFQESEAKPQSSGPKLGVQASSQLQQPATSEVINLTKIDGSSLISEHTIDSRQQSTIGHVTGVRVPSLEASLVTFQKSEAKPQSSGPKVGVHVSSQLQQSATSEVINVAKIDGSSLISEHTINSGQQSTMGHDTGVRVPSLEAANVTFQKSEVKSSQSSGEELGGEVSSGRPQPPPASEVVNLTKIDRSSLISHTNISRQQWTTGHATGVGVSILEAATDVTFQKSEVKLQSSGKKLGGEVSSGRLQPPAASEVMNVTQIDERSLISQTISGQQLTIARHGAAGVRVPSLEATKFGFGQKNVAGKEVQNEEMSESGAYPLDCATPMHLKHAFAELSIAVLSFNKLLLECIPAKVNSLKLSKYNGVVFPLPAHESRMILKAEVMSILFETFENETLSAGGDSPYADPVDRKREFFDSFQNFQVLSSMPNQAYVSEGSYDEQFFDYYTKTKSRVLKTLGVALQSGEKMELGFRKAAQNAWAIHLLRFSFDPPASLIMVQRGAEYDQNYMSPQKHLEFDRESLQKVAFMMTPGVRVRKLESTVKSEIYPMLDIGIVQEW